MNFLYVVTNVCVPFSMMLFETIKRDSEGLRPSYGKWLALFLLTFVFNGFNYFGWWPITFADLALKCSLYFLPESMNEMIEDRITSLHLESLIQSFRNALVNLVYLVYQRSLIYILNILRPEQAAQFKEQLGRTFSGQKLSDKVGITVVPPMLENTGINCTLINADSVAKSLIRRQLDRKRGDIEKRLSSDSRRSESEKSMKPEKESVEAENYKNFKNYAAPTVNMTNSHGSNFRPAKDPMLSTKQSFKDMKQSSKILPDDFQVDQSPKRERPTRFSRQVDPQIADQLRRSRSRSRGQRREVEKIEPKRQKPDAKIGVKKRQTPAVPIKKQIQKKDSTESGMKRRNTDISDIRNSLKGIQRRKSISPDSKQQIQMLQKLDVSASQYSDMFDEDREDDLEEGQDEVKQICRVESIVEIGTAPTSKLEIYYLELYSNGDLRIMSLYGREFEKHKIVSMAKSQNNYYILHLNGGSVNQRRVKFRGQFQPFMKYLQTK